MRLSILEPIFLTIPEMGKPMMRYHKEDGSLFTLAEADGIRFICPQCYKNLGNTLIGAHSIVCWRPHVPQTQSPTGGRWDFAGTNLEDITLFAPASSILLPGPGCGAHFFIRNGEILI